MHRCYELHAFVDECPRVYDLLSEADLKLPLLESLTLPKLLDLPFVRSATKLRTIRTEFVEKDLKELAVENVELATWTPGENLMSFPKAKAVTLLPPPPCSTTWPHARVIAVTGRMFCSDLVSSLTVAGTRNTMVKIEEMLCKVEFPNLEILKLVHFDCTGPPLRLKSICRPLKGTSTMKQLVFQGFAIRLPDMLDILRMVPRLTCLSIYDSPFPLFGPYRPVSNALLGALADKKIVPNLERLNIFWRHDLDIDDSLVKRLLDTRRDRLIDVVARQDHVTPHIVCSRIICAAIHET
ncbi:uncharacterized protein BT62DRAFT_938870 [Guyanagaster necrorhizus]|uniref:Uncharacterized protein n=1 Tax=Guyanagaster necrorhizus TaxID=856835 RepID=A0A9P8AKT0_9AGAR|nr:uncharacterized protein BT62DRAFT_938870 [Guyanagaster necrorhizus MCA 3950]KAG7439518.1 hypothetical protein BT62DRAFT_938870 [Guyanagaster necrorhizus MCA 3950]